MRKTRRLSDEAARVLELFVLDPGREIYGLELLDAVGLRSGSLYPILHRLEGQGMLRSRWESMDAAAEAQRRPRRLYQLDERGARDAKGALTEWANRRRSLQPASEPAPGWT